MARWEPDAPGRLQEAALALFDERGFEGTTVEDIATRAGVTKRTFFRHFADKREVLFAGGGDFERFFAETLAAMPLAAAPMEAMAATLEVVGAAFHERRAFARRRGRVIVANAGLHERELIKLASVAAALAAGLRARGVGEPAASVVAETGVAVFRSAYERWVALPGDPDLPALLRESLAALRAATAATAG